MSKFKIGDDVWVPTFARDERYIDCPDCLGKRFLTVIMGDGATVTIDCVGCSLGYDPPRGVVKRYEFAPDVKIATINGIETHLECGQERTTYRLDGHYSAEEENLFSGKKEAEDRAKAMAEKHSAEENARIMRKERDTRSWAWNATYHRRCIADAEKSIKYHRDKLDAAKRHISAPTTGSNLVAGKNATPEDGEK